MQFVRYVTCSTKNGLSVQIQFNGGVEGASEDPEDTSVRITLYRACNPHSPLSPWVEVWSKSLGNPPMPGGAWNGVSLTAIVDDRVFAGAGCSVSEYSLSDGHELWSLDTANTPVGFILPGNDGRSLIVQNGYYGFEHPSGLSNVVCLSLDGSIRWRAELPEPGDVFASHPRYDGAQLKVGSWNSHDCTISESNGRIVAMEFTK